MALGDAEQVAASFEKGIQMMHENTELPDRQTQIVDEQLKVETDHQDGSSGS